MNEISRVPNDKLERNTEAGLELGWAFLVPSPRKTPGARGTPCQLLAITGGSSQQGPAHRGPGGGARKHKTEGVSHISYETLRSPVKVGRCVRKQDQTGQLNRTLHVRSDRKRHQLRTELGKRLENQLWTNMAMQS